MCNSSLLASGLSALALDEVLSEQPPAKTASIKWLGSYNVLFGRFAADGDQCRLWAMVSKAVSGLDDLRSSLMALAEAVEAI